VENKEGNLQYPLSVFRAQRELPGLCGVKIENKKRKRKKDKDIILSFDYACISSIDILISMFISIDAIYIYTKLYQIYHNL
jgi:hypothetical protein